MFLSLGGHRLVSILLTRWSDKLIRAAARNIFLVLSRRQWFFLRQADVQSTV
jgi:hypothetical protein